MPIVVSIAETLAYVVLYGITGVGLGFIIGVAIGNVVFARDKPGISEQHKENARKASIHNSQWSPTHKKWREEEE